MTHHSDNVQNWMHSNRLYEDNLFYYTLIIVFWFFVGLGPLGFELDGYSLKQNLFFNFLYYLFICVCMALCPFWFKLFFAKTHTAKREQEINHHLDELDQNERVEIETYLAQTGQLAMRPMQKWALVFLGSYFLFEVFFILAWVKDLSLVWQPEWVSACIEWAKSHVNIPPLNIDRDWFLLQIDEKEGWVYDKFYQNEVGFLNSTEGSSVLFYHCLRVFFYLPVLTAFCILLWRPLLWLGVGNINPEYINGFLSFIRACAWSIVMAFFFVVSSLYLLHFFDTHSIYIQNIGQWTSNFSVIMLCFFFSSMAVRFFAGWFLFWKRVFLFMKRWVNDNLGISF